MIGLVLFFLLSLIFSFLCSVWEAVLLSITPSYINTEKQKGSQLGKDLEKFKKDIDRPLSAILTLNTIAHTVGAIGVGERAAHAFGEKQGPISFFGFFEISITFIVSTLMTLAILIGSEIIPKTYGANRWRQLAPFTVKSIKILLWILHPFVWLSERITRLLKKDKEKAIFTRFDFVAMASAGEESGTLAENESEIIRNLLRFEKIPVKAIMTPRTVATLADANQSLNDFYNAQDKLRFSRIPIYEDTIDNVVGLILKDDLFENIIKGHGDWPLSKIKKEVLAVNQDKVLPEILDTLTKSRSHLAIAVDEFGGLSGIVTMEDVFETLLGLEIVDEVDAEADLQELARKRWEERAKRIGLIP